MWPRWGGGGEDLNTRTGNGWKELFLAVQKRDDQAVKLLLQKGTDPNIAANDGWTALHEATYQRDEIIVKLLLDGGAEPNARRNNDGWTVLREAVNKGNGSIVLLLLQKGANPDLGAPDGWTALHEAAFYKDEKIAKLLLDWKADPNARRSNDGWSVICEAVNKGSKPIIQMLLVAKAKIETTELREAARQNDRSILQLLEESIGLAPSSVETPGFGTGVGVRLFDVAEGGSHEGKNKSDEWFERVESIRKDCFEKRSRLDNRSNESKSDRVKIAILDTGIRKSHTFFDRTRQSRIKECKSFIDDQKEETDDLYGHGTHIAGIVMQVAPEADLYIGRVIEGNTASQDDAHNISEGIKWAIKENVDIISLSLGFNIIHKEITGAIDEAKKRDILIFASASNGGANNPITFPARLSPKVFCIHASDGYGNKWISSPPPEDESDNFSVVGAGIKSAWIPNEMLRKSGTSFSTPVAAATAALVLEYVKQIKTESSGAGGDELVIAEDRREILYGKVHQREGMVKVFKEMGSPKAEGFRYLKPWVLWGEAGKRRSRDKVVEKLEELVENV